MSLCRKPRRQVLLCRAHLRVDKQMVESTVFLVSLLIWVHHLSEKVYVLRALLVFRLLN